MVSVPGFLLRRLYVKGSLRNTPGGFQFALKNTLGSGGYGKRMLPLTVDGREVPMERALLSSGGVAVPFSEVSEESPFTLAMNRETVVSVLGPPLEPGPHRVEIGFEVQGLGALSFDFTDVVHE